ncbi:MAG: enoyl-CoA hydratase-related protein, partial [Dehalococcoidia bacterium]
MAKVDTERRDRVYIVTINRPAVRNAVDAETAGLLEDAVNVFIRDEKLRVMVLTGAGDVSFCAGADLKAAAGLTARPGADKSGPMGFSRITSVQKPTIAAVNGFCLAGGLELACWCDFRVASANAKFGVVNRRWGVPLIDGGTQRLPSIVGLGNALYLIETGAMINSDQALRMGLIQEIVTEGKAISRALELAAIVSAYPWTSLVNDRRAVYEGLA